MKSYLHEETPYVFDVLTSANFNSFVALDFETTGLSDKSEIIEIGAVKVIDNKATESFSTLICPNFLVSPQTESITGLTNAILADQPELFEVFPSFCDFIGDHILLGHNIVNFDSKFLLRAAVKFGKTPKNPFFDTLAFARRINREHHIFKALNLEYLTDYFGIDTKRHHRALDDALSAARLYYCLRKKEKELTE